MTDTSNIFFIIACALVGYVIGSFQTAVAVSKHFRRDDIRKYGSGNAGTSNMIRVFGFKLGFITFVGDFLKGILAVAIGRALMDTNGGYIAGAFAAIGHCWPVFSHFKGGKAVATSFAVVLMVSPSGALVSLVVGLAVFFIFRMFSLMSLSGTVTILIMTLLNKLYDRPLTLLIVFLAALVLLRHIENIKRIIRGEEKRFERQ